MVVVSSYHQARRWITAITIASTSALLHTRISTSQVHLVDDHISSSKLAIDCLLSSLFLIILPPLLSSFLLSPCQYHRCTIRNLEYYHEQMLSNYIYASFAVSLLCLRGVVWDIVTYCCLNPPSEPGSTILLVHISLAHMALRRLDKYRGRVCIPPITSCTRAPLILTMFQHRQECPGSWTKDRIFPVHPPLNSTFNIVSYARLIWTW